MNDICCWILCFGVLISIGLSIAILLKQEKCCKNKEKFSGSVIDCDEAKKYAMNMMEYGKCLGKGGVCGAPANIQCGR